MTGNVVNFSQQSESPESDSDSQTSQKFSLLPWFIVSLGALFYCYEYYLRIAPSVMTHDLMRTFGIDAAVLGNLTAFYYYAYTPMQLPVGVLMDRFGPRRLLFIAVLSCSLGSYLFASTTHLGVAEIGRFLIGFGSAFAFVGALQLATVWLPPERFAFISGFVTTLGMLGAIGGDISLTYLVNHVGWKPTILYAGAAGIVLAILIITFVRDKRVKDKVREQRKAHSIKEGIAGLGTLLKKPAIWINGLIGCLLYVPTSAFAELWGIPYLERVHGFTQEQAATGVATLFLGWAIGGPLVGILSDWLQVRRSIQTVGSIVAVAFACLLLYLPSVSHDGVYVLIFLFGLAASTQVLVFPIALSLSPRQFSGTALALTNMLVMLGGALFQPTIGYLLEITGDSYIKNGVHVYSVMDYKIALSVIPIGILVATILTRILPDDMRSSSDKPAAGH